MTRTDYALLAVRMKWQRDVLRRVTSKMRTRVYLAKGNFQDEDKG